MLAELLYDVAGSTLTIGAVVAYASRTDAGSLTIGVVRSMQCTNNSAKTLDDPRRMDWSFGLAVYARDYEAEGGYRYSRLAPADWRYRVRSVVVHDWQRLVVLPNLTEAELRLRYRLDEDTKE